MFFMRQQFLYQFIYGLKIHLILLGIGIIYSFMHHHFYGFQDYGKYLYLKYIGIGDHFNIKYIECLY